MSTTAAPLSTSNAAPATAHPLALRLRIVWPLLRIAMSLIFLWAFLDKTFALGFATGRDAETGAVKVLGPAAWVAGASPTSGFLQYGTSGPLAPQFAALAGNPAIDWLFMLGMGGVGIALLLGIATRLATVGGVTLMLLLGLATWQSENNPIVNEHLIYALVLVALAIQPETRRWSLDPIWRRLPLVHRAPLRR